MEEKKQVKISLGTAICIFLIIILVAAMVGTVIYYNRKIDKENGNKMEIVEENVDKIAKELYERAESEIVILHASELTREYNLKSPRLEKEINGETYVATTEKYEVIENKYKEIFTGKALENILETWRYANVDGVLYVSVAGGGSGWNTTITHLEKTDVNNEEITYVGSGITQENEYSEQTEIYFKIKKVNGEYRISEMDLLGMKDSDEEKDDDISNELESNESYVGTWKINYIKRKRR